MTIMLQLRQTLRIIVICAATLCSCKGRSEPRNLEATAIGAVQDRPQSASSAVVGPPAEWAPLSKLRPASPVLAAGATFAWCLEQANQRTCPVDHVIALRRSPFAIVVTVRSRDRFDLLIQASFDGRAVDDARTGRAYAHIRGVSASPRLDAYPLLSEPRGAEADKNQRRDLWVDARSPSLLVGCPVGGGGCSGFDAPCDSLRDGLTCTRTVERLLETQGASEISRPIGETAESELFLVFFLSEPWSEDEKERVERGRDWVTIRWAP